ncbi:Clavaminate synthase-like protein [Epithele typhae]|uniref:Clavaminate synthase-like protein n=1 Tax=Epithele typhae TaxID=378194 RepID=UPI002007D95E|nr:Clavaminate synthase-like protein [Epithele typhae]KAH9907097.1 Clavaminate synthase-like protein [Epithele typhae]
MPVAVPAPELGQFNYVPETKEKLDWADLTTLDFSLYGSPRARNSSPTPSSKAFNFNISQERVNRQFSLGKQFYELPLEEKLKYVPANLGGYNGYVASGRRILDAESGIRDRIEIYNIPKFDGFFTHNHPSIVQDNLAEIEEFARSLHTEVLNPLHILLAIALELPEDYFLKIHDYSRKSEDHFRYMKYTKFTPEENAKIGRLWGRGHTDLGSWTLLFRQPVAALQIRHHTTNEWKWVRPQDGTLTVNACDALSFLTGGYVKSTVHRVAAPPKDQEHVDRLGILYFSRPNNEVKLETIKDSPVLQREGFVKNPFEESSNPAPTMEEWTFAKQKWQRVNNTVRGDPEYENAQIVPGYSERRYV